MAIIEWRASRIPVVLLWILLGAVYSRGQQNALPPEELLDAHLLGEGSTPSFSPDGNWVAYALRNNLRASSALHNSTHGFECSGVPWHAMNSWVVVRNIHTGESFRLGSERQNSWLPQWSPNGRFVAFLSDGDGGQAKLWVWERSTHLIRKLSDHPIRAEQIEWTADSRHILTTAEHRDRTTKDSDCPTMVVQKPGTHAAAGVLIYQSNPSTNQAVTSGPWSLDEHIRDLAFFDVASGAMERVTDGERIEWFELSPDSSRVAFSSAKRFEQGGSQQIRFDLMVIARKGLSRSVAAEDVRLFVGGRAFVWAPDGNGIVFEQGGPLEVHRDCFWADMHGGLVRNLTRFADESQTAAFFPPVAGPDLTHVYFLRNSAIWETALDGKSTRVFAIIPGRKILWIATVKARLATTRSGQMIVVTVDERTQQNGFYGVDLRSGSPALLLERNECYWYSFDKNFISVSPDGRMIVYSAQSAGHPQDLWISTTALTEPQQLTHTNPGLEHYAMGTARLIDWRSLDGKQLHGALLLPPGYKENKRYPLIVWVYGGASLSARIHEFGFTGLGEPFNFQLFSTRGYAVLAPDSPQQLGTPMLDLLKTILPGVDRVVDMGIADPARIGVMGESYGGYSVMSLLVQTSRFRAAVAVAGFADLTAAYGQLNADGTAYAASREHGQEQMGGTPWLYRDRYIENSPIFYLNRVETPLLLVHGGDDQWVHPSLSDEVFVGLRRLGKEVSYAKYPGEDHTLDIWDAADQLDVSHRILDWFGRYLGNSDRVTPKSEGQ
jgi:dipeptidyl aminopeptidase/acylaminoacyl peptidase